MTDTKTVDEIIGMNIRRQRTLKGWSQSELGERLGITFQQIQKYESGVNAINANKLVTLAVLFQCSITTLFDHLVPDPDGDHRIYTPGRRDSRRISALMQDFVVIESPAIQEHICRLVRSVAAWTLEQRRNLEL